MTSTCHSLAVLGLAACQFSPPPIRLGEDAGVADAADSASPPMDGSDVADGTSPADARSDAAPDASTCNTADCTAGGGTCDPSTGWCILAACGNCTRTCPDGHRCEMVCGDEECKNGITVNCGTGSECRIVCRGENACEISSPRCLGGARCDLYCYGNNVCQGQVRCTAAECEITCDEDGGSNTCLNGVDCETATTCSLHCCPDCGTTTCPGDGCAEDMICPANP